MAHATITSQGQITMPKAIRDRLGVKAGDRVAFRERDDGSIVVEADSVDLRELRGAIRARVRGVRVEDMSAAVRRGATKRAR